MRAREVVLAAGAIERPLVFRRQRPPGILLAEAPVAISISTASRSASASSSSTAHDSAYRAALDLRAAGVAVALIADLRDEAAGPLPQAARAAGIEVTVTGARMHGVEGPRPGRGGAARGDPAACGRSPATRC